jgi:APA family basic amino acid/polyamine antiporter
VITIEGLIRLRRIRPDAERPYKALGYPLLPLFYVVSAVALVGVLFTYQPKTSLPGLAIVFLGVPVYFGWKRFQLVRGPRPDVESPRSKD